MPVVCAFSTGRENRLTNPLQLDNSSLYWNLLDLWCNCVGIAAKKLRPPAL